MATFTELDQQIIQLPEGFGCKLCKFVGKLKWMTQRHVLTHDANAKRYQCQYCAYKTAQSSKLALHHKVCSRFKCQKCGNRFRTLGACTIHMRFCDANVLSMSRTPDMKEFLCDRCDFKTMRRSRMVRHILTQHINGKTSKTLHHNRSSKKSQLSQDVKLESPTDKQSLTSDAVSSHRKHCVGKNKSCKCQNCDITSRKNRKSQRLNNLTKREDASQVSKSSKTKSRKEVGVQCGKCGNRFMTLSACTSHMKRCDPSILSMSHRPDMKAFVCNKCGFKAMRGPHMRRHILAKHKNSKISRTSTIALHHKGSSEKSQLPQDVKLESLTDEQSLMSDAVSSHRKHCVGKKKSCKCQNCNITF